MSFWSCVGSFWPDETRNSSTRSQNHRQFLITASEDSTTVALVRFIYGQILRLPAAFVTTAPVVFYFLFPPSRYPSAQLWFQTIVFDRQLSLLSN